MAAKTRQCLNFAVCHTMIRRNSATGLCERCYRSRVVSNPAPIPPSPAAQLETDREKKRLSSELTMLRSKYDEAVKTIERQEEMLNVGNLLSNVETYVIEPKEGSGTSEGTIVAPASDWHLEELVDPATISGLNSFNLDIANQRVPKYFQGLLRLIRLHQQDLKIHTLILALLGDFITNDIHDELTDITQLRPTHAIKFAQDHIISGLEFLLNNSKLDIVIPCHSGNHARTTRQTHFSAENGHSLEWLMYLYIAAHFRNEPRIRLQIAEGMHSYVDVYGKVIRFQHGHAIKYNGGVGGIYIPTNKAIAQWNKARTADIDVFGHFHQNIFAPNFVCNGSLIGYNGFALSIKADYEEPKQAMFLMDKKRGRTAMWPILLT